MVNLIRPSSKQDFAEIAELFREYSAWLAIDSCAANVTREMTELPGQYGPPSGSLLLARQRGQPAGCVALRKYDEHTCEMKRLHVRPTLRGRGIGRDLATALIHEARRLGYETMRLDSLAERMPEAVALYRSLGFKEIPAYGSHPEGCTLFMELNLQDQASESEDA